LNVLAIVVHLSIKLWRNLAWFALSFL